MNWLTEWLTNPFFYVPMIAWLFAQLLKAVINLCVTKQWKFERLFGDGGMPSGHAATVIALATTCGLHLGTDSEIFAISIVVAIIICHDAMGVRHEAGKHALLLTEIIQSFNSFLQEKIPEVKLKKFIGHTFLQVIAGAIVGVIVALTMYHIVY